MDIGYRPADLRFPHAILEDGNSIAELEGLVKAARRGLDISLRMGYGSSSGMPWGKGLGKGSCDWLATTPQPDPFGAGALGADVR